MPNQDDGVPAQLHQQAPAEGHGHHRRYRALLQEEVEVRVSTMSVADTLRKQVKERKMVSGTMGLAEGHPAHILDAAELLEAAWNDVTPATIAR